MTGAKAAPNTSGELRQRVISALVLIVIVVAATWFGGRAFRIVWIAAAMVALHEWLTVSSSARAPAMRIAAWAAFAAVAASVLFPSLTLRTGLSADRASLAILAVAAIGFGLAEAGIDKRLWATAGLIYALSPAIAISSLRDGAAGLLVVLFLYAAVWATDILAYFTGRALKGPKLAPKISPGKTWSGALGGIVGAIAATAILAAFAPGLSLPAALITAIGLSVISQAGDLGESAFKRHFGVKDSGKLIPGHGGILDRIDALVAAAVALHLLSLATGGLPPGFGL